MHFKTRLSNSIKEKGNNLCLGIDLHLESLPPFFTSYISKNGPIEFAQRWVEGLLEIAKDKVPAVKFQSSFFEALGFEGLRALQAMMKKASSVGLLTILDVKRCDIASTMRAYGKSAFDELGADAMTVIPYMGLDVFRALYPWMEKGHGVYSVFLSSNPEGFKRQSSLLKEGSYVALDFHESLFEELKERGLTEAFGLVVGASSYELFQKSLEQQRRAFPFLLPGLGFQGGCISSQLKELLNPEEGHLFPVSRSLTALGNPRLLHKMEKVSSFSEYEAEVAQLFSHFISDLKA